MGGIKWYHWWMIGVGSLAMFIGVVLVVWFGFYRGEVVSYGDPLKTYLKPEVGIEGTEIQICFDDVVWKNTCPSRLVTHLTPAVGSRLDLPVYNINVPARADRVPPKCRWWKVPMLGDREPGMAVLSGHVRSECTPLDHWYPIYTPMPSAKFNWLQAR